jgi:hypothetical protein
VFAGVDRSYIFEFHENGTRYTNTHEWCAPGIEPQIMKLQALSPAHLPWIMKKVRQQETTYIPSVANSPGDAEKIESKRLFGLRPHGLDDRSPAPRIRIRSGRRPGGDIIALLKWPE